MKQILILILSLSLSACLDMGAAIVQTATPSPTPSSTPTITAAATNAPTICTVTAAALHIRSGAGIEHPVIGYLKAGDIVTIQNQRGAWYETGDGWIHSKYCEVKK